MKVRKPRCDKSHTGVFGRNSYQILKFCLVLNSYGFYIIPSLIIVVVTQQLLDHSALDDVQNRFLQCIKRTRQLESQAEICRPSA